MNEHRLEGCKITPLSNYLKSLGLLRIMSKKDPKITASWENDRFIIKTEMSKEEIQKFLLHEYSPTPIINPWSYDTYKTIRDQFGKHLKTKRFGSYEKTIKQIKHVEEIFQKILKLDEIGKSKEDGITKSIVDENKILFLKLCRNNLPDEAIPWLDAAFVLGMKKPNYAPILLTGGNDGRFDMSRNFIERVILLFDEKNKDSEKWLYASLFGDTVPLNGKKTVGYNPDGSGGPNAGMGFEGKPLSNPWDYVLMMEGTILFAGNLSKHLSSNNTGKAVFPFTSNASNVGYATASNIEHDEGKEPESKGEIWLPVWKNTASYKEIKQIFNEGRIQLGGKQAKTGTEFARAIITLGTERGISQFQRFCILKRKGKAYLFINAGKMQVTYEPTAILLEELDKWYKPIAKKSKKKGASASLIRLVRNLDDAIMKFCTYRKKQNLLQVLITAGKLERYTSGRDGFKPLSELSDTWITECDDGSAEFRLAASIASINDKGSIRENLENVVIDKGIWKHKKDSTSYVWKENDNTLRNMGRVLHRRSLDGKTKSLPNIPINGHIHARKNDIIRFLDGKLDTKKIGDLVLPFSMMNIKNSTDYSWKNQRDDMDLVPMPEAYMIIKLIVPPHKTENIPYDMSVLNMLHAERINDAYTKASYILHTHGLSPLRYSKKTGVVKNVTISDVAKKYLTASLLFPISNYDRNSILKTVIQDQ